ncbi:MAG: MFS transporter [Oligoflexia bacterium]|nr:MFS transporter [Oligoflexia bacterium]
MAFAAVRSYFSDFKVLKDTRKEYWALQGINVLDCTAYFALYNVVIVSLTADFGFTDVQAGYTYTLFSSATTLFLFFSGLLTDWLGIKKSLYISIIGLMVLRVLVVVAAQLPEGSMKSYTVVGALFAMAPFMAMLQTLFQSANKRFTTTKSRGAGFNLWYLFMNVGAAIGGFVVDIFYLQLGLPRYHIFSLGVVTGALCILVTYFLIKRTEQLQSGDEVDDPKACEQKKNEQKKKNPWQIAREVLGHSSFWRFVTLITLLIGVQAVFLYLGLLHPLFWLRVIGPDANIGALQALNPIIVIIGLLLLIPILGRFNIYSMLILGAFINSIAMFIIAIPPAAGSDVGQFTYVTTILFLVLLTVGEVIWSPRLQEYTAAIAPAGQEGTYFGLSMVPYFLAKSMIGLLSGHMLNRWCPEGIGDRLRAGTVAYSDSPYMMWMVLGVFALGGTLAAYLLKGWFTRGLPK